MIRKIKDCFVLDTRHTTYLFSVMPTGHLQHLYYGRTITVDEGSLDGLKDRFLSVPGGAVTYDESRPELSLENVCLEMSSLGKGDIREPFLEIVHHDGSVTSDFLFDSAEITEGKRPLCTLPSAYAKKEDAKTLCVLLKDRPRGLTLKLYYHVFYDCDVVVRSAELVNESENTVRVRRLLSAQLDCLETDLDFTTFTGAWGREMCKNTLPVSTAKLVNASAVGASSNHANPFVMLSAKGTSEDYGDCLGVHLIYSGNHYECVQQNSFEKTRLVVGINPQSFCYTLGAGESLEAPEAAMSFSPDGFNGLSANLHSFIREHIVRGNFKNQLRPIVLNSWEAAYFQIDEEKLVSLAKAGKEVGVELFVMDDGWFGDRDDDYRALGDWWENPKKLPNGLAHLADRICGLGLKFGLWVEPEMVNKNSRLYESHPDWVMQIPGLAHSEERHQRILDLSQKPVQDFVIQQMSRVFSSAKISYVKWDMNRIFSDVFSSALPPEKQGEVPHRYMLGLYRCLGELTARFPDILFEGCASGGNRFDLGMLCYFPQIWASDNTDAVCRTQIQTGYSYGYPMNTVSAHVSACPNLQTLRTAPLETRFHTACFGVFGYECDLRRFRLGELEAVKQQIALYKEWRDVLQTGRFYRGRTGGNVTEWTCVSADKKRAVGFLFQKQNTPNASGERYCARGLNPSYRYHFYSPAIRLDTTEFQGLVAQMLPDLADGNQAPPTVCSEQEDCVLFGDALMHHGVIVRPRLCGLGPLDQFRFFPDFASRLYFMEAVEPAEP